MKCLVTGGAGFIGSHLSERLLELGHEVTILDNFDKYYEGKERNIESIVNDIHLINGSILDTPVLNKAAKDMDFIFHQAAQAGVRASLDNPLKTITTNITGTVNVLHAAREQHVKGVINASSSSVYGEIPRERITEEHAKDPISPYGLSKLTAERYLAMFHELFGLQTISLRYFTVYGRRHRPDMAIRIFGEALKNGGTIRIFGDGEQMRDFTHVSDIVEANLLSMKAAKEGKGKGQVYNIGGGNTVSVNDLVSRMIRISGNNTDIIHEDEKQGDVKITWADNFKARQELGWRPKIGLDEGLEDFFEWLEAGKR